LSNVIWTTNLDNLFGQLSLILSFTFCSYSFSTKNNKVKERMRESCLNKLSKLVLQITYLLTICSTFCQKKTICSTWFVLYYKLFWLILYMLKKVDSVIIMSNQNRSQQFRVLHWILKMNHLIKKITKNSKRIVFKFK
jgi:hypothetical protein